MAVLVQFLNQQQSMAGDLGVIKAELERKHNVEALTASS
jgi:hypothetical protein